MNTQTHVLIAAALFAKPGETKRNTAVILGALAPDIAIFTLFIWSKLAGIPESRLWNEIYFSEPMLSFTAVGNSAPLYAAIALVGMGIAYAGRRTPQQTLEPPQNSLTVFLVFFALAALTHLLGDLPVHVDDAHPHFWPFTHWRFESPLSYWDRNHYGQYVSFFEAILGVALAVLLWRRFKALWVRALLMLALIAYIGVPLYFILQFG